MSRERVLDGRPTTCGASVRTPATTISVPSPMVNVEPVPLERRVVGAQDDVRRGVVRVGVHGVRAVVVTRRREADVDDVERVMRGQSDHPLSAPTRMPRVM